MLFADEATSGLDSAMARLDLMIDIFDNLFGPVHTVHISQAVLRYNVCKMLRDFARGEASGRKRTVFATIHQPSEEVFNLFDKAEDRFACLGVDVVDGFRWHKLTADRC